MQAIKHTLTERWYAWEHARKLALDDGTVDLTGRGLAYDPSRQTHIEDSINTIEDVTPGTKTI
jgi:large subunit ribosomal protein L47